MLTGSAASGAVRAVCACTAAQWGGACGGHRLARELLKNASKLSPPRATGGAAVVLGRTWPGVAAAACVWWSGQRGNPDIYPPGVYGLAVPAWPRNNSAPGGNKLSLARA